jgi:hypothetical protein
MQMTDYNEQRELWQAGLDAVFGFIKLLSQSPGGETVKHLLHADETQCHPV